MEPSPPADNQNPISDWRHALSALEGFPLLPCGAGPEGKAPMDLATGRPARNWQRAAYSPQEIAALNGKVLCCGTRTGPDAHGLLSFDLDGESAIAYCRKHGCDPHAARTWHIVRNTDPHRLKICWRVPPDHWEDLGTVKRKHSTRPAMPGGKGEQVELFFGKGQILVLGHHLESGGYYYWPEGHTPAELSDIPPQWWELALLIARGTTLQPITVAAADHPGLATAAADPVPLDQLLSREQEQLFRNGAGEGSRDADTFRLAVGLLTAADGAAAAGLPITGDPERLVLDFAARCRPPFPEREALAKIASALSQPRQPDHNLSERVAYWSRRYHASIGAKEQAAAENQWDPSDPYRVGDCPPDLHAADLLYAELEGHVTSVADTLFRYHPDRGCWEQWSDAEATSEAQTVLRRMYRIKQREGKPNRKVYQFGSINQQRNAVACLKAKVAGRGPLGDPTPPAVIVFSNGTYNLLTGQLEPHSPANGATYRIDAPYMPDAPCPAPLRRVIEVCFPEGAEPIIRGLLRWVADPTIRYGEAFHLLGESGTGKGILLTFAGSLLPASLRSEVGHPADLDSPERLHQFVLGRRLIIFPDTPSRIQGAAHCGRFYELVENSSQTTRKLRAGEAERSRPMFARCMVASVKPLQFPDGRDGFHRRVRTLMTLPRTAAQDPALRADLVGNTESHRRIRGEAVSWALAMPLEEVEAVLDGNDPEGLLREAAAEAAAASDTVSQWADECLIPHHLGPNQEVDAESWAQMYEAYLGWCRYSGVQYAMQRTNFKGQLRTVLGPKRCLPRRKESMAEVRARGGSEKGDRQHVHRFDAGFTLRPGVLRGQSDGIRLNGGVNAGEVLADRHSFNRMALGTGGLKLIEAMPQATHPDLAASRGTPPPDSPGTSQDGAGAPRCTSNTRHAGTPGTPSLAQSKGQGCPRRVPEQSESPRSTAEPGVVPSVYGVSQGSFKSVQQHKKEEPQASLTPLLFPLHEGMTPGSPGTPPTPAFTTGDMVEVQTADGWRSGYRVADAVETSAGLRIRVEEVEGNDFRIASHVDLRPATRSLLPINQPPT
jgi:hypothetical protein